jgi:site-specific recombinase XerD
MRSETGLKQKTLAELVDYYETCNRSEGKSPRTVQWYSANLRQFRSYLRRRRLSETIDRIDIKILREYVLYLQQRKRYEGSGFTPAQLGPLASASVHGHVRTLRAFYSWLVREELVDSNIGRELKPPRILKKMIITLSDDEISSIMTSFSPGSQADQRNHTIFLLLFDTGIRIGELIGLRIEDVRMDEGFIRVLGKGNKQRLVPVGNNAQKSLQKYLFRFRPNPASQEITNVFLSANGYPLTVNSMKLMFAKLAERAGVPRLHAHLCRHTFATRYLTNGGNVFALQQILGHSTLDMVKNYVDLAASHVAFEHHKFSPLDRFNLDKRQKAAGRTAPNNYGGTITGYVA